MTDSQESIPASSRRRTWRQWLRPDPLWRKAPLVLLRWPALFVSVVLAALLLAAARSSAPLFVSAAGSSTLRSELDNATRFGAGATVDYGDLPATVPGSSQTLGDRLTRLDNRARHALDDVSAVDPPVFTVFGAQATAGVAGKPLAAPLRLLARTGALEHVTKLERGKGGGIWIADESSKALSVQPGDSIYLKGENGQTEVRLRVAGVYRALWKEPSTPYWRSLFSQIYELQPPVGPAAPGEGLPPPFLIGDRNLVADASARLGLARFQLRWEWPLVRSNLTIAGAELLELRLGPFQRQVQAWTTRFRVPPACKGCPSFVSTNANYSSLLPTALRQAKMRVSSLRGPVDLLAGAGSLVALALVGAVGALSLARRRTEALLLRSRGVGALSVGARSGVEATLPALLGALAGLLAAVAAVVLVSVAGVSREAVMGGGREAALAVPATALLIGGVFGIGYARMLPGRRHHSFPATHVPWELPVLVLAALLLYRLRTTGAVTGAGSEATGRPTTSVLLFPLLFTAGCSGLAARGLHVFLRKLRNRGRQRTSEASFLAVRRLAGAGRLPVLLVTAAALSLGTFVFAQSVTRSLEDTVVAKSLLFVGSDVKVNTNGDTEVPLDFPLPATKVTKAGQGLLGAAAVDVMAVDPETLGHVAYWDASWADRPFQGILNDLRGGDGTRLPVIVAGAGVTVATALELDGARLPITVVAVTKAFPGMSEARPLVVASRSTLERLAEATVGRSPLVQAGTETEIWVKGDRGDAVLALKQSAGLRGFPILTAQEVRDNPTIRSVTETFGFLRVLSLVVVLLSVLGTLLYLQARQRNRAISYALARRMGLHARIHRASLIAELTGLLLPSLLIGTALALIAVKLVLGDLDTSAELPSGPLFRTPWDALAWALLGLLAFAVLGGLLTHRLAQRVNVASVLRSTE